MSLKVIQSPGWLIYKILVDDWFNGGLYHRALDHEEFLNAGTGWSHQFLWCPGEGATIGGSRTMES